MENIQHYFSGATPVMGLVAVAIVAALYALRSHPSLEGASRVLLPLMLIVAIGWIFLLCGFLFYDFDTRPVLSIFKRWSFNVFLIAFFVIIGTFYNIVHGSSPE